MGGTRPSRAPSGRRLRPRRGRLLDRARKPPTSFAPRATRPDQRGRACMADARAGAEPQGTPRELADRRVRERRRPRHPSSDPRRGRGSERARSRKRARARGPPREGRPARRRTRRRRSRLSVSTTRCAASRRSSSPSRRCARAPRKARRAPSRAPRGAPRTNPGSNVGIVRSAAHPGRSDGYRPRSRESNPVPVGCPVFRAQPILPPSVSLNAVRSGCWRTTRSQTMPIW